MTVETQIAAPGRRAAPLVNWRRVAAICPALVLAYPMLVWPLAFSAFNVPTGTSTGLANITASESNALNVLYFLGVGALAVGSAFSWPDFASRIRLTPAHIGIIAYLILAGLSALWALDTPISFRRFIQQDIIVFAALFVGLAEPSPRRIINALIALMVATVAINILWLGVKAPSPIGVEGIFPHKNELGAAMIVATPFLIFGIWKGRGFSRLVALAALFGALLLLDLSRSKTSVGLVVLVPVITTGLILAARTLRVSIAGLFFLVVAVSSLAWFFLAQTMGLTLDDVSMFLFGDPTFTGRTEIWDFAVHEAAKRPLLGYGFNSFWAIGADSPSLREARGFIVSVLQAHNGYLDIRLETGLVGLSILAGILIASVVQAGRMARTDVATGWLALTLILQAILHNSMESSFFRGFRLMWISFLIGACLSSARPADLALSRSSTSANA